MNDERNRYTQIKQLYNVIDSLESINTNILGLRSDNDTPVEKKIKTCK